MTQTEALKLALEALQKTRSEGYNLPGTAIEEAITAIKAALAQPAQQEPVAFLVDDDLYYPEEIDWETLQEQGHTVAALYTSPPAQRTEERNFCSRCGKRTADLTVIHTCTPPQPEQEPVAWATRMGEYAHIHWGAKRPEYPMVYEAPLYTTPPQQEPVAMKFKIYKPTVPDPMRQGINNALLPWVYDQDRSSGFDASMWVTPVATLPPQRKPLTDEQIKELYGDDDNFRMTKKYVVAFARAIEAAHGIKE